MTIWGRVFGGAKRPQELFPNFYQRTINEYWKLSALNDQDSVKKVHIYYKNWVQSNSQYCEFQDLYQNCMIRSASEVVCETVGSMMNEHSGKNCHLNPSNF